MFEYVFMQRGLMVGVLLGAVIPLIGVTVVLRRLSMIGDALSHSVVPGVAIAYAFSLPYALGAFFAGILAALSILWIKSISKLKEDAVIGFIFSTFFALGLLIISLNPTAVNVQSIILGNILGIADEDIYQVAIIIGVCLVLLLLFWKDLLLIFFDETQARTVGLSPLFYKVLFFTLLSACVVAALQTVGAILVIAMVVTPGATAYLLTDKFKTLSIIAIILGAVTSFVGVYISYYLDGATGGVIVTLQTLLFLAAFLFSPKYGLLTRNKKAVENV